MSQQRKPASRPAARSARAAKPESSSSARGNWIDKVDRLARRPLMEGDYMPGPIQRTGDEDGCKTPRRGTKGR
jgi:hypothetical protein